LKVSIVIDYHLYLYTSSYSILFTLWPKLRNVIIN